MQCVQPAEKVKSKFGAEECRAAQQRLANDCRVVGWASWRAVPGARLVLGLC